MIEKEHPHLSIRAQCGLLDLAASTFYAVPQPVDAEDLLLMRLIDEQYLRTPFYGVERMTWVLHQKGWKVNVKRVRRLMRIMALQTVYARPRTSLPGRTRAHFPYLLSGLTIDRPDVVWAADITYVPMQRGYCYLCAVIDWHTRCVLAWELSTTLEAFFCVETLERALASGRKPLIFNTDQGSQFTCEEFVSRLQTAQIRPSWDGKGRWRDNVFVERLWRSYKQECVYLNAWTTPREARRGSSDYFQFYNHERPHTALDKVPPAAVYFGTQTPKTGTGRPHPQAPVRSKEDLFPSL